MRWQQEVDEDSVVHHVVPLAFLNSAVSKGSTRWNELHLQVMASKARWITSYEHMTAHGTWSCMAYYRSDHPRMNEICMITWYQLHNELCVLKDHIQHGLRRATYSSISKTSSFMLGQDVPCNLDIVNYTVRSLHSRRSQDYLTTLDEWILWSLRYWLLVIYFSVVPRLRK